MSKISINLIIYLLFYFYSSFSFANTLSDSCIKWFKNSKIDSNSADCELKCATIMVDMGTFTCPSECQKLCTKSNSINRFIYYPALNEKEKKLIKSRPFGELILVYKSKIAAEQSSLRNFPVQKTNDEGDAFRHYIWAGLLTKELGSENAKVYLDAHEANPLQPQNEKSMDLANNRGGILGAQELIKENNFNQKNLEQKALIELENGNLIVIEPRLEIPKEPLP
ncbi:MAG: DUF6973 domain-containing protein [Pseudobdellovibrionaceae bacterium]